MHGIVAIVRSSEGKSKVYEKYGMTPRGVEEDVAALKAWLYKQPHLPYISGENVDQWLENYLITCKNSLERAKDGLDVYFSLKSLVPEVFSNRDPLHPGVVKSSKAMAVVFLPKLMPSGRRVVIFSHLQDNAEEFDPVFYYQRLNMILEVLLQEGIDYSGLEVIIDTKKCCFGHITKYNPTLLKRLFDIGMKGLPQRVNRIHIVNPCSIVETGVALFKQFMSKKLQERMVLHRRIDDLQREIPKNLLPNDFGGDEPSLQDLNGAWQNKLMEYRQWFLHNESIKADETKRVGKCRFQTSLEQQTFGTQGSFRKIEVD
ncbi:retinol-binding protein pinta-like [Lycorma delicatula]|uniref:retinol-binding protein pinta-like n=1 Tax=Lycorma delicatula TaxID=130591 RepID=UPI003F51980A